MDTHACPDCGFVHPIKVADDPVKDINAAKAGSTVLVNAGTFPGTFHVPDGVTVQGAGFAKTHLKGEVTFGSNVVMNDLKVGDAGKMFRATDGGTSKSSKFHRVQIRGGGGPWGGHAVLGLGFRANVSELLFKDCNIECNLGTEDAKYSHDFNNIGVFNTRNAQVGAVTLDHCQIGVHNGVRSGSPRMDMECYTVQKSEGGSGKGWSGVTVRNSTFEVSDLHALDLADAIDGRASTAVVVDNFFKGAGARGLMYGSCIDVECPTNVVIRGNRFLHAWQETIMFAHAHEAGPGTIVTGNTFDLDVDNGIPYSRQQAFHVSGRDIQFTGNTINFSKGPAAEVFQFNDSANCKVTGNTIRMGTKKFSVSYNQNFGNIIAPNTFV